MRERKRERERERERERSEKERDEETVRGEVQIRPDERQPRMTLY